MTTENVTTTATGMNIATTTAIRSTYNARLARWLASYARRAGMTDVTREATGSLWRVCATGTSPQVVDFLTVSRVAGAEAKRERAKRDARKAAGRPVRKCTRERDRDRERERRLELRRDSERGLL